ncbi:UNVERIFIED_CONTAM: hypothetical protein FKN15_034933 [Acipenser sinensis]
MKKIVQQPLIKQKGLGCRKAFGISLLDLQQQGLIHDGIPSLVKSMVEYLMEQGLQQEGLFRVNGNLKVVDELRQRYKSREDVDLVQDGDVCSVASLLKLFLRELPDGVITSAAQPAVIHLYQVHSDDDQLKKDLKHLLQQLPDIHYCLLKEANSNVPEPLKLSSGSATEVPTPVPRKKKGEPYCHGSAGEPPGCAKSSVFARGSVTLALVLPLITQSKSEGAIKPVPQPGQSAGIPQVKLRVSERAHSLEEMERADEMSENIVKSTESLTSFHLHLSDNRVDTASNGFRYDLASRIVTKMFYLTNCQRYANELCPLLKTSMANTVCHVMATGHV